VGYIARPLVKEQQKSQVVAQEEDLPSKWVALSSNPSTIKKKKKKPGIVVHTYNTKPQEAEAG
jgi:hypothetical protein